MSHSVAFARNSVLQITGRVVSTALGVIAVALVARYLGRAGYGHYSTVIAFLQLIAILADLGLYLTLLQELGEKPIEEHSWRFGSGLTLRMLTGLIAFGLAPLIALVFPYPAEVKAGITLMSLAFWLNQIATLLNVIFQRYLKTGWAVLADVLGRLVFVGATILVIYLNTNLLGILAANALNSLVWAAVMWWAGYKLLNFKLQINWSHWKTTLIKAWPIGLGIGLNLVYFKADTLILSLYRSAEEVGLYGAPYRVLEIVATIPHLLMGLALPILAAAWASQNLDQLKRITQKLFDLFWVIIWPIVGGCLVAATPIMTLVAGSDFKPSGGILKILIIASAAIFFGTLFNYLVVVTGQQKTMLWIFGAMAAVGCTSYLIFIPLFGYWAAAWITVLVELGVAVGGLFISRRKFSFQLSWKVCGQAMLASLIMAILLRLSGWQNAIVLTVCGGLIYAAMLIVMGVVPKQFIYKVFTNNHE